MTDEASGGSRPVVLGLLAPSGLPREIADELAEDLPAKLGERHDGVDWKVDVEEVERATDSPGIDELKDTARRRMLDNGWNFAVGLTDLPLRADGRPLAAHANASYGVGLVSIPALGATRVAQRAEETVLNLLEQMLGGRASNGAGGRLHELRSPIGRARAEEDGTIRFAGATLAGNLRLLVGMVRANQPSLVIARLSRALLAALGTAAYALSSANFWTLADGMSAPRLAGLGVGSVLVTTIVLVLAHRLWERASDPDQREQVVLFNLATSITLLLAVLTLYLALFLVSLAGAAALIPAGVFESQLQHPVGLTDYLSLAWLVAGIATLAGALGSLLESNESVRAAAYRFHPDEDTEVEEGS